MAQQHNKWGKTMRTLTVFGYLLILIAIAASTPAKAEPLHDAAMAGDVARIEHLLQEGADVNASDAMGTALHWAILLAHTDAVRLLLERGADPNAEAVSGTPLYAAARKGDIESVTLLLQYGAEPNGGFTAETADRSTPLHQAASNGYVEVVGLLLERGADPNLVTFDGTAPLHEAAKAGHLEIAQRLVERSADVNALTAMGEPPIHFAKKHQHEALATYLKDHGARPGEIAPISDLLASADLANGELKTKRCTTCHTLEEGKNRMAPSLWNIVGRPKASVGNYTYSPVFAALEGVWTFEALNEFLARPAEVIPGNRMAGEVSPMPDAQERADVIAYLTTLSDNPVPLP
ncbi:MAG: ankyrin repeat domain-containing protein [Rhodospirillales bacterium]|nr:ankyrin repeat domain-containing protein [Rhodospirillales bacterium]